MAVSVNLETISSGYNISKINTNFQAIDTVLQDAVSRSGVAPNQMDADFDMNGNDILNVDNIDVNVLTIDGVPVVVNGGVSVDPDALVPTGGTDGQVLTKQSAANYDVEWEDVPHELPVGGTTGQLLAKNSGTDYDVEWIDEPEALPAGGTTGQVLTKQSGTDYDADWEDTATNSLVFNVLDYGAVADGVADDGPAIQDAIDACYATSAGGIVLVPRGNYKLATQVTVPKTSGKTCIIQGEGEQATEFIIDAGLSTSTGAIYIGSAVAAGGVGVTVRDLRISGAGKKAIYLENANIIRIERVSFSNLQIGVEMEETYFAQFHSCTFVTMSLYGIVTLTRCHGLNVNRCGFYDVTGQCILLDGATASFNINITENDFETFGTSVQFTPGVHSLLYTGNYAEFATNALFYFAASSTGVVIEGNFLALSISTSLDNITSGRWANNTFFDQIITAGTAGEAFLDGGGNFHTGTGSIPTLPTMSPSSLQVSDTAAPFVARVFSAAAATASPNSQYVRGRGTRASPAPVVNGDRLGAYTFGGQYDTTIGNTSNQAAIISVTTENWSATNRGAAFGLETTPNGSTTRAERWRLNHNGMLSATSGSLGRGAPVTKTGDFTLADNENWILNNKGSACVVTLPAASSYVGREVHLTNIGGAFALTSASSNVVPKAGGAAGTAILAATDGVWATLVSDGTNWIITQAGT